MHILLLNQYFPPDPAPTGILLDELAAKLREDGHTVAFASSGAEYRSGQARQGGRMRREVAALLRILVRGLRSPKADVVISASSPPLLLAAATLVALRHRARSIHWAMDLYPELAVALGEIRQGFVAKTCQSIMRWCYRKSSRVVALDEDMAGRLAQYGVTASICRPWVFAPVISRLEDVLANGIIQQEPWTWIYSGNLGRAHEWETLLQAQQIIEQRNDSIRLLFQGSGPSWPAARQRAATLGLRRCEWHGYCEEEELPGSLLRAAVCVATQRPEAAGLLWPSKLGLLLALPRPILWVGSPSGAITSQLRHRPQNGLFAPGDAEPLANWVLAQHSQTGVVQATENPAEIRAAALSWWSTLVQETLTARAGVNAAR